MPVQQHVGHLQLVRKTGEAIVLTWNGVEVEVKVDRIEHGRVTFRVEAPRCIDVARRPRMR